MSQSLEKCGMSEGPLGVILDNYAKGGLGLAGQPDGTVTFQPNSDIEADAPPVFAHLHRLAPESSVVTRTIVSLPQSAPKLCGSPYI
jgi:hypothetical protein